MAFGASLLFPFPPFGIVLILAGAGIAIYHGTQLWQERRDPYDLSRLYETLPDEPENDDDPDREYIYCHRCGGSLPAHHSICPECGGVLGH